MSRFSDRCKELMSQNQLTAYRISKTSGLELTSLQRMVTGKRLPQKPFVKDFCRALCIPYSEEKKLMELYQIEQLGEDHYKSYQCILSLLTSLHSPSHNTPPLYLPDTVSEEYQLPFSNSFIDNNFFKSEALIRAVLKDAYCSSNSHIYTNCTVHSSNVLHPITRLLTWNTKHMPVIRHLINFQMNSSLTLHNIQSLQQILPLSLSSRMDYTAYYYYSNLHENDLPQMVFPFYIITPSCVLEISNDYQSVLLHTEAPVITLFKKEFEKACSLATPLMKKETDPENAFHKYLQSIPQETFELQEIQFQPCLFPNIILEDLMKKMKAEMPDLYPLAQKALPSMFSLSPHIHRCYFTSEGLHCLCETGKFRGQMATFFPALSKSERGDFLESLRHSLKEDDASPYRMFRTASALPKDITIEFYNDHTLQITQIHSLSEIAFVTIEEPTLCNAFCGFLEYLEESDLINSRDETLQFLTSLIDSM